MKSRVSESVIILAVILLCSQVGFGAGTYSPIANLTERWTNGTSGWFPLTLGTNINIQESIALVFTNLAPFDSSYGILAANSNSSGGRFVGDYTNSAISSVTFDIKRMGLTNGASFAFTATNKHIWTTALSLPSASNTWESRTISMTWSTNWTRGGVTGAVDVFEFDRSCVSNVKFTVYRDGESVQQLQIDNFKVVGPWEKGPFWADGVPKYWLIENGLTNQEGMATNDWDNDGFNNFGEYMAGTDPKGSNSLLKVTINKVASSNAVTLSWPRADYRTYKVLMNTNLADSAYQQYTGSTYQAVGATNQMTIGGGTNGSKFFKIEVDK